MRICYGWARTPLTLSSETRYYPEHLMSMIFPYLQTRSAANPLVRVPIWVNLDDQYIRLDSEAEALLACRLASIYHNGPDCRAPPEDGWESSWETSWESAWESSLNSECYSLWGNSGHHHNNNLNKNLNNNLNNTRKTEDKTVESEAEDEQGEESPDESLEEYVRV